MKQNNRYAFGMALCTFVVSFVGIGMWQNCPGIFFQPVADSLGIGRGQFSFYLSAQNIANMITLIFAGNVLKRMPFRPLLSISGLLAGGCFMLMSTFRTQYQFYLTGIVLGVCLTFCGAMIVPVLINNWFRKNVGTMIGLSLAFSSLGGAVFNLILSRIIQDYGWQTAYLCLGGVGILLLFPISALLIRFRPEDLGRMPYGADQQIGAKTQNADQITGLEAKDALRTPSFYFAFSFVVGIVFLGNISLSVPAYANSLGLSQSLGGTASSLVLVGGMVCKLVLGWLNDKIGIMKAVAFASISGIAGVLLLIWAVNVPVFLIGAVLLGFGYAMSTVEPPIITKSLFGLKDYGTIYSYITVAVFLTGAIASPLYNTIFDVTGSYFYSLIFSILVTCLGFISLMGAMKQKSGTLLS